jgi:soluble lytic murein transglycosylase
MKKFAFLAIFASLLTFSSFGQKYNDASLSKVIGDDQSSRNSNKVLPVLPVGTHLYRAEVYMANRHFPEAREHWQKVLENYSTDSNVPSVLFGMGRSYMWERNYASAVVWFDRLFRDFTNTAHGRNGLNFKASSYVRWGKSAEAAETYKQYVVMFPYGEKIDSAYLNIIDALRELGKYDEANEWVDRTVARFKGLPVEVNALHAKLRMEIRRTNWKSAVETADTLLAIGYFSDSMAWTDEVKYLKAYALEKSGKMPDAKIAYLAIPDGATSYYGGLATERLDRLGLKEVAKERAASISKGLSSKYPIKFRSELLKYSRIRKVDPRFLLAVMMQESGFRVNAKSPAAARGLLQLVFDTAIKYNKNAGFPNLQPDDLYIPATNIAIGSLYISDLKNEFGGLYEAIAASYNGGEDNAARWLSRTDPKDPGVFASEVGFKESKDYVFKVMSNYRVYRELYTENLVKK